MPGILKQTVSTYEFSPDEIARLIAADLDVSPHTVRVEFKVSDVSHDMERSPRFECTKIVVTRVHTENT